MSGFVPTPHDDAQAAGIALSRALLRGDQEAAEAILVDAAGVAVGLAWLLIAGMRATAGENLGSDPAVIDAALAELQVVWRAALAGGPEDGG